MHHPVMSLAAFCVPYVLLGMVAYWLAPRYSPSARVGLALGVVLFVFGLRGCGGLL